MITEYSYESSELANIAHALFYIGRQLRYMGTNNAISDMGAIEFLTVSIKEGLDNISASIGQTTL